MVVYKCKMCGATLNITKGVSVCTCDYCNVEQTIPTEDNEKMLSLFARANRLRLANEFDKAAGIYESIVSEFPEEAEAYWGLVLCKYGIEYVDDPTDGRKVPTCHRSSFESVMDDDDFEQTLENADVMARGVYREEAKQIEELRKRIIEVSSNEEPYDIFICYKETDENGDRTLDSVIAEDVYTALTDKGYRVFFSRISLEDKLGVEFEPYIFAALNSAKIMLVFGTDYEYFNAVWVKNEWSRFLKLIAKGEKKALIPCYKNVDAYDMPKEFAKLQAQDMGKVGAVQDLLRGIDKLIKSEEVSTQANQKPAYDSGAQALLERAFLFLEDKKWSDAEEYCNKVLDLDPKCAKAYLGKLMAEFKCANQSQLPNTMLFIENSDNFKKAIRFDEELSKTLNSYVEMQNKRLTELSDSIAKGMKNAKKLKYLISTGYQTSAAVSSEGNALVNGYNYDEWVFGRIRKWDDLVAIAISDFNAVGLKSSGKVVCEKYHYENSVDKWEQIAAIDVSDDHIVGLKYDGTVVAAGKSEKGECKVKNWTDIEMVVASDSNTAGLRKDGTVVCTNPVFCVDDWKDIVDISLGYEHIIGLRSDGTVVACGDNYNNQCNVENWKGVVAVEAGKYFSVGLCVDGTIIKTQDISDDNDDSSEWTDIVAIKAGQYHLLGVKKDGTVVAAGSNYKGECNVKGWRLFDNIDTFVSQKDALEKQKLAQAQAIKNRIAEERKRMLLEQQQKQQQKQLREQRIRSGLCTRCGGEFRGLFSKKCSVCGAEKDY